jgi:hypothetical protein
VISSGTFAERIVVFHQALDDAGIEHAFGGALALAYYVEEPRATRDIDVNVSTETAHAATVLSALPAGIELPPDAVDVIVRDGQIRLWWDGRSGFPVDIFFPQHELHEHVARAAHRVPFLDTEIPIISSTHLTVFKCLFNRARDWPDVAAMLQAGTPNADEALNWLARLVGTDSAPYLHLAELVRDIGPGATTGRDRNEELPVIDWRVLGNA